MEMSEVRWQQQLDKGQAPARKDTGQVMIKGKTDTGGRHAAEVPWQHSLTDQRFATKGEPQREDFRGPHHADTWVVYHKSLVDKPQPKQQNLSLVRKTT